jgi:4-hydroxythreonine-4-phosphate dehydrogenase
LEQRVAGIVTAPINKEALNLAGHHYAGHTEILAERTGTKNYAMLLIAGDCSARCLRVVHVTTHVSIKQAVSLITEMRVLAVIRLAANGLRLLGCEKPRIAVAGLNPHASENSLFGNEEADIIMPAIEKAQSEGYDVTGPLPPDTVFVKALAGLFDVVVAMYHDQGHIPLKLVGFMPDSAFSRISGVNCTLGIPVIRTSVDHGTAFDKAGKNCSSEQSMVEAIEAACMMANTKNRICGACNEL